MRDARHDARDTGSWALVESLPQGCRWLAEIDDDDLNWTGFVLPGEPSE